MVVLLLLHEPPPVASVKFVVSPAHTVPVPVMADGNALTVIVVITLQPVDNV